MAGALLDAAPSCASACAVRSSSSAKSRSTSSWRVSRSARRSDLLNSVDTGQVPGREQRRAGERACGPDYPHHRTRPPGQSSVFRGRSETPLSWGNAAESPAAGIVPGLNSRRGGHGFADALSCSFAFEVTHVFIRCCTGQVSTLPEPFVAMGYDPRQRRICGKADRSRQRIDSGSSSSFS